NPASARLPDRPAPPYAGRPDRRPAHTGHVPAPHRPAPVRPTWRVPAGCRAHRNGWWYPRIASAPANAATGWPCSGLQSRGYLRAHPGRQLAEVLYLLALLPRPGIAQVQIGPLVTGVGIDRRQFALVAGQFCDRAAGQRSIAACTDRLLE